MTPKEKAIRYFNELEDIDDLERDIEETIDIAIEECGRIAHNNIKEEIECGNRLRETIKQLQTENEELKSYILNKVNLLGQLFADVQFNQKIMIIDIKKFLRQNKEVKRWIIK